MDDRPPPVLPCRGYCRGERSALDSPAKAIADRQGRVTMVCQCCTLALRPATPAEQPVRPPNLSPEVTAEQVLYKDDVCGYDAFLLANIRAR